MKKIVIVALLGFCSCSESKEHIQKEIGILQSERIKIQNEIDNLRSKKAFEFKQLSDLQTKSKVQGIKNSGRQPKYILTIQLKQSRISLNISSHIKDAMNKISFQMPVDEEFYNQVSIGSEIMDEFRMGSFILRGSFSSWEMTVKNKQII